MRGLITRIFGGQAPLPEPTSSHGLAADLDRAIADQRRRRLERAQRRVSRRFEHARPKVEQLRAALTQHAQKLRDEAGA